MTEPSARRHAWADDETRIAAADTDSGNGETIRMWKVGNVIYAHPAFERDLKARTIAIPV